MDGGGIGKPLENKTVSRYFPPTPGGGAKLRALENHLTYVSVCVYVYVCMKICMHVPMYVCVHARSLPKPNGEL